MIVMSYASFYEIFKSVAAVTATDACCSVFAAGGGTSTRPAAQTQTGSCTAAALVENSDRCGAITNRCLLIEQQVVS